jgi:hypothetical protein
MNRRNFLKNIFGLLSLIPFISTGKDKPLTLGVDKASSESDMTGLAIFDNQRNLVDMYTFDEPLTDYDLWVMRNKFNCRCVLEVKEDEIA